MERRLISRRTVVRSLKLVAVLAIVAGTVYWVLSRPQLAGNPADSPGSRLQFDESVNEAEKLAITAAVQPVSADMAVHVNTILTPDSNTQLLTAAYVPVSHQYATRQAVTTEELTRLNLRFASGIDAKVRAAMAGILGVTEDKITTFDGAGGDSLGDSDIAFIPVEELSPDVKLLRLNDDYYLDDFTAGAVFRQAVFAGEGAETLKDVRLNSLPTKDSVFKMNQTGVTALTRVMIRRLAAVNDPLYFSEQIGDFLADADITHVSNEVSFKEGCTYHDTLFCSPPEMIEVLKDSGVDLVELTGNHNNDVGASFNTETIELYHSLGWQTVGGGLNTEEAAKFYTTDQKGSRVALLAYNYPDAPNGGAIAGSDKAGANAYDAEKVKADIERAKTQADFVIVDVQFWECYAYPDGYVEFPSCDGPIAGQAEVFRQIADLGADMVVGTSAHQPQTYEIYNGVPIYFGLGNLYFDQSQWPGTERGVVLTHYFVGGKLLQTKLSPTVYHREYQTRLMTADEAASLLERLNAAR